MPVPSVPPVLLVVDAPGGPHPSLYLPSLLRDFAVHVLWLDVERPGPRSRRLAALAAVADAGGLVRPVGSPRDVESTAVRMLADTGAAGAVAFSERVVHATQAAAWRAGLPANPPNVLAALQDKRVQRARLRSAGLTVPVVWELTDEVAMHRAVRMAAFPAVVKPSMGMGSLATFRVEWPGDLEAVWAHARELVASDARVAHHDPVVLLEEELRGDPARQESGLGDYLSVEALVCDGEMLPLAVSDKLPLSYPYRENGHLLPAVRSAGECAEAVEYARRVHRALGVRFGATHTEIKLTADGCRVIEINGRVGGSVPEQMMLSAGYDLPVNLARLAVGDAPTVDVVCTRWSMYLTPQPPLGRHVVESAPSAERLRAEPGVCSVYEVAEPGQVVDSAHGTASNLLRAIIVADSVAELLALADQVCGPGTFTLRPREAAGAR